MKKPRALGPKDPLPQVTRITTIRLIEEDGSTIGLIHVAPDADDDYIRSLIPDGCKAMIRRNYWPMR